MTQVQRDAAGRRHLSGRDRGVTLIEILITIVLLGTVVVGTMASLRTSILAETIHRDHSNAHGWLQSASDMLYAAAKTECDPTAADSGEDAVRTAYRSIVKSVPHPQEWATWQITVVGPVKFWNAGNLDSDPDVEYFFGSDCDPSLNLQLVTIEVRNTDGAIIETVEIVK